MNSAMCRRTERSVSVKHFSPWPGRHSHAERRRDSDAMRARVSYVLQARVIFAEVTSSVIAYHALPPEPLQVRLVSQLA